MSNYEDSFENDSSSQSSSDNESAHVSAIATRPVEEVTRSFLPAPVLSKRATEAIASGTWGVQKDPLSGREYYYNAQTHKTTWNLNEEVQSDHRSSDASSSADSAEDQRMKQSSAGSIAAERRSSVPEEEAPQSAGPRRTALTENIPIPAPPENRSAFLPNRSSASEDPTPPPAAFQTLSEFQAFKSSSSLNSSKRDAESSREGNSGPPASVESKDSKNVTTDSSSNDNLLSAAVRERKAKAVDASQGEEYQNLKQFVAFGDPGAQASSGSSAEHRAAEHGSTTASSRVLQDTSTDSRNAPGSPTPQLVSTEGSGVQLSKRVATPAKKLPVSSAGSAVEGGEDTESSSMLSTLSHHLQGQPALQIPSVLATPPASVVGEAQAAHRLPLGGEGTDLMTAHVAPVLQPAAQTPGITWTMPPLPNKALEPIPPLAQSLLSAPPLPSGRQATTGPLPSAVNLTTGTLSPVLLSTSAPPAAALPLTAEQKAAQREQQEHERRIEELRETSQAVERLVTAFATLRGHPPAALSGAPLAKLSQHTTEHRDATPAHRVGALSTVQTYSSPSRSRQTAPAAATTGRTSKTSVTDRWSTDTVTAAPPAAAHRTADEAVAEAANSKLLEEVLQECVLSMMAERRSGVAMNARRPPPRPPRHRICVSAEEFSYVQPFQPRDPRAAKAGNTVRTTTHLSVFDGEMSAFAPPNAAEDADADSALQNAVREALEKYVWSRVLRPPGSASASPRPPQLAKLVPLLTPFVAWTMLLDIMTACRTIIEWGLAGISKDRSTSEVNYPVLVRFDGPAALEEVARAALHCLPFEAVASAAGANGRGGSKPPLFRLEYWVTRERLFSVLDALNDSLRHHLVAYANELHYAPFYDEAESLCLPNGVVPPHTPYFSVLPPPNPSRGPAGLLSGAEPLRARRGQRTAVQNSDRIDEEAHFGVGEDATEKVAHVISSLATDILEKESQRLPPGSGDAKEPVVLPYLEKASDFPQLCSFVAETAGELFQDEKIRAALERRAAVKMKEFYAARGTYACSSRLQKEKQLMERAEAEAEGVVARILQELHAHQTKQQHSLS